MPEDPDTLVVLTSTRTEFEANTIVASLEASGIQAKVFAGAASVLQIGHNSLDSIKVMVRAEDRERAQWALRNIKQDSVDLDWDEVDVGDTIDPPDAFPICPGCGFDRAGVPAGSPCPECGYKGIASNRATPRRRSNYRPWLLRTGGILLVAAMVMSFFNPQRNLALAIAVLVVAVVMIVKGAPSGQVRPGTRR